MKSHSSAYIEELGGALARSLGPDYSFAKSRARLSAHSDAGDNILILAAAIQYSPGIMLYLHFGRAFEAAKRYRKALGHRTPYDIHQNTMNLRHMRGLDYSGPGQWLIDIREPPAPQLVLEVKDAIQGVADPFFTRFDSIEVSRDAIAADDGWCLGGWSGWAGLLCLDAALGDLGHFERWCDDVLVERERERAASALRIVRELEPSSA